jgi:NAD(P)-dependent dehydrogenase (short-subunit alcohol dehydrogenase family)
VDSLTGKVVVVTGGASGIGLAMARRFGAEGARIALADVATDALEVIAGELRSDGIDVLAVPTDVSDAAAVEDLAARTVERFGAVHVVCNNAGTVVTGRTWEIGLADWRRVVGVNFWGVVHGIYTFVPLILASGEPGYVVNTASMAGVTSLPTLAPYVATKHAVVALSEVLYHDLGEAQAPVGVTVVCPGMVATHIGQADKLAPLELTPGGGVRSAEEVAAAVRTAMAEHRFYVFTHSGSEAEVSARVESITHGQAPWRRALPRR